MGSYYSLDGIAMALSIYHFPQDYYSRPRILLRALSYLFIHRIKYGYRAPTIYNLTSFANRLFRHFQERRQTEYMREVADIVDRHVPNAHFLERIRELDEHKEVALLTLPVAVHTVPVAPPAPPRKTPIRTVYGDSQNVHNSKINQTVIQTLQTLYSKYKTVITLDSSSEREKERHKHALLDEIKDSLKRTYRDKHSLIEDSVTYIKESAAIFGENSLTLADAFLSVWMWIVEHKYRAELELRLLEEMKEMGGYCTTGHIARLMNVIQGFSDDESLCIRITEKDQCAAVVKQYLTKELSECEDDEVLSQMIDGGEDYVKFIRKSIAKKILEWKGAYGKDFLNHIATIVNDFAKTTVFSL